MVTVRYGHLLTVVLVWFGITTPIIGWHKWHQRKENDDIKKWLVDHVKEQREERKAQAEWDKEHMPEKYALTALP